MGLLERVKIAIDKANKTGDSVVALTIDEFQENDQIVSEVLWYARNKGVDVIFITPVERKHERQEN